MDLSGVNIGIIMDGNGRWARRRGLPRIAGHKAGVKALRNILPVCAQNKVKSLTVFAFSQENWNRPSFEVKGLMKLLLESLQKELETLLKNDVRLGFLGRMEELSPQIQEHIEKDLEKTRDNRGVQLNLAINYGGRQAIFQAFQQSFLKNGGQSIETFLPEAERSSMDILIRTSAEKRLSNFMLWPLKNVRFYTTETLWPDFTAEEFESLLHRWKDAQQKRV